MRMVPGQVSANAFVVALLLLFASSLAAQGPTVVFEPMETETVSEFRMRVAGLANDEAPAVPTAEVDAELEEATETVAAQPSTPAAPVGFADRVNESITNFLPLLQFAVNSISTSDDEKSITVNYNPIRIGSYGNLAVTTSIVEPEPFEQLVNEVVDAVRSEEKEAIKKSLGDFDDLTWSATFGIQRPDDKYIWGDTPRLWGRNPKLYDDLIADLMAFMWRDAFSGGVDQALALADFEEALIDPLAQSLGKEIDDLNFKEITEAQGEETTEKYAALIIADANSLTVELNNAWREFHLEELAHLIDNQPQLILTATRRERASLVGPDSWTGTIKYELGTRNFNRLLKHFHRQRRRNPAYTPLDAYTWMLKNTDYLKKDKFSFFLTYKSREGHSVEHAYQQTVTDPMTIEDSTVDRTASLELTARDEWSGKIQWSHAVERTKLKIGDEEAYPRIDLSAEYIHVQGDPDRQNRIVARLNYQLPLSGGLALPVSLTYADKSEFLGEADHQLSAHLALSYKLDRLLGGGEAASGN